MSIATMSEPEQSELSEPHAPSDPQRILTPTFGSCNQVERPIARLVARPIVRRGNREQGQALETLGHAIEYLVDSRMFLVGSGGRRPEAQAIQILMVASRGVFDECPEVVSIRRRLAHWLEEKLFRAA